MFGFESAFACGVGAMKIVLVATAIFAAFIYLSYSCYPGWTFHRRLRAIRISTAGIDSFLREVAAVWL